jgi:RHS repeat-associated protein
MVVISDRGVVQSAQDYFPFGMAMPGRSTASTYKYGFNGQEKDTEIGEGIYTAEFWQYDARLGRRMNLDPVTFPWESPYATFHNNPIYFADPKGDTPGTPDCPDCANTRADGKPEEIREVVVTAKAPEALKQRKAQEVQSSQPSQLSASMLGSLPKPQLADAQNKIRNTLTKFSGWVKSRFYIKANIEVSLGAQAGAAVLLPVPETPLVVAVTAKANLGSITLVKGEYDTRKGYSGNYAWQDGGVHVTQELSGTVAIRPVSDPQLDIAAVHFGVKSEFDGYDGYALNEKTGWNPPKVTSLSKEHTDPTQKGEKYGARGATRAGTLKNNGAIFKADSDGISLGVGLEATLLMGVKFNIEVGMRSKK